MCSPVGVGGGQKLSLNSVSISPWKALCSVPLKV